MSSIPWTRSRSPAPLALLLAAAVAVAGCDGEILDTQDPDVVTPEQLEGPNAVPLRIAGVVNDFREAFEGHVQYTGMFTDEFVLAGTFPTRREVDERQVLVSNATLTDDAYELIHTSRFTADEALEQFQAVQGDPEFEDVAAELQEGIAVAAFHAGYSRVLLAEGWCQSILGGPEGEPAPLGSDERMQEALTFLQDAEQRAADAGRADLETAAQVGQARAHLWLEDYGQAADVASGVPTEFVYTVEYSANTDLEENAVYKHTYGDGGFALRWTVGNGDIPQRHNERYAYYDEWVEQGLVIPPEENDLIPFGGTGVPISAQTLYSATSVGGGLGADMVLASGWEARMIEAENLLRMGDAGGAQTIVNELLADPTLNPMRAVNPTIPEGAFEPVSFTGDLASDLEQLARARQAGLWLTGQRIATSRRYLDDGVDLFPQGTAGNQIALPVIEQELNNNPNINEACPAGFPGF